MSKKIYAHDGWRVIGIKNGKFGLSYDSNVLAADTLGAIIEINEIVFNAACDPNIGLKDLFDQFNLYNNKVIAHLGEKTTLIKKTNTINKYYGRGFIAIKEGNKYFLKYILSRQGGGSRKFEISKEIYDDAREGDKSTSDLFKKHNLYHLDVPENDEK